MKKKEETFHQCFWAKSLSLCQTLPYSFRASGWLTPNSESQIWDLFVWPARGFSNIYGWLSIRICASIESFLKKDPIEIEKKIQIQSFIKKKKEWGLLLWTSLYKQYELLQFYRVLDTDRNHHFRKVLHNSISSYIRYPRRREEDLLLATDLSNDLFCLIDVISGRFRVHQERKKT